MKKLIQIIYLLLFVSPCFAQSKQIDEKITVDGMSRTFVTYLPAVANKQQKMPLLISIHGGFGTGKRMMSSADFRPIADTAKFIIVCPDGLQRSWNDGRKTRSNKKDVDDVKFIDYLITYCIKTYNADKSRVYVTGMSNGGFMASRLACELYKRIAAVACVASTMDKEVDYSPIHPMPLLYIHGTADPLVPYGGGEMTKGAKGLIYGHTEILDKWAAVDGCNKMPVITNLPDKAHDGTNAVKEVYKGDKMNVTGYTIINAGHCWPDSKDHLPEFITGKPSDAIDACTVIWDFCRNYKLN
jgi:polyhydroxybutyrate depolymerase